MLKGMDDELRKMFVREENLDRSRFQTSSSFISPNYTLHHNKTTQTKTFGTTNAGRGVCPLNICPPHSDSVFNRVVKCVWRGYRFKEGDTVLAHSSEEGSKEENEEPHDISSLVRMRARQVVPIRLASMNDNCNHSKGTVRRKQNTGEDFRCSLGSTSDPKSLFQYETCKFQ